MQPVPASTTLEPDRDLIQAQPNPDVVEQTHSAAPVLEDKRNGLLHLHAGPRHHHPPLRIQRHLADYQVCGQLCLQAGHWRYEGCW